MTYSTDLVEGLAELLAAGGLGVYRPEALYDPAETGIVLAVMPPDPDRAICLTDYPVEDTDQPDAITAIQIRMRAGPDPRAVSALADDVFDLLHNRRHYRVRGIHIALSWRNSQAWIGQDAHGRMEIAANFYLRTTRPAPHLND